MWCDKIMFKNILNNYLRNKLKLYYRIFKLMSKGFKNGR